MTFHNPAKSLRCLDARVVKGVDLRSTGLQAAWVRTPLQALIIQHGYGIAGLNKRFQLSMMCPLWGLNP